MIYGLLHRRIGKRITQEDIKTYDDPLQRASMVEQSRSSEQKKTCTNERNEQKTIRLRPYYERCSRIRHTIEHCRRRIANGKKEGYLVDAVKLKRYGYSEISFRTVRTT